MSGGDAPFIASESHMEKQLSCCWYRYVKIFLFVLHPDRIPAGPCLHHPGPPVQSSHWTAHTVNRAWIRLGTKRYRHSGGEQQDHCQAFNVQLHHSLLSNIKQAGVKQRFATKGGVLSNG